MNREKIQRSVSVLMCCVLLLGLFSGVLPVAGATPLVEVGYYGREQLAEMNNSKALLYAYDQIVAGVESAAEKIEIYNGTNTISKAEVKIVMDVYLRDHVEQFWLGSSYTTLSTSSTCLSIKPAYTMTGTELQKARAAFDKTVDQILSGLKSGMSEAERELYLHDQLASLVVYDKSGANAHNAYGAIVEGLAVCEGYAEALQYLLQRAGIRSFIAKGQGIDPETQTGVNHAWNYVRIDGKYYHVDLTWNDQSSNLYHAYFNQTDQVMQEDHAVFATDYALPSCTATEAMYFTGKDTYMDNFNAEKIGGLLKANGLKVHLYIPGSMSEFLDQVKSNRGDIADSANIIGSFSYISTWLGHELILTFKPKNPQPTDPTPTEPSPTDPAPAEPQPTEPKPTEPKPTEPKPTEPKPTEPKPTEPKPTDPLVTEPQATVPQDTEPQVTEPRPTTPSATEPKPTEPKPTDSVPTEPLPTTPQTMEPTAGADPAPTDPPAGEENNSLQRILLIALPVAAAAIILPALLRRKRT